MSQKKSQPTQAQLKEAALKLLNLRFKQTGEEMPDQKIVDLVAETIANKAFRESQRDNPPPTPKE